MSRIHPTSDEIERFISEETRCLCSTRGVSSSFSSSPRRREMLKVPRPVSSPPRSLNKQQRKFLLATRWKLCVRLWSSSSGRQLFAGSSVIVHNPTQACNRTCEVLDLRESLAKGILGCNFCPTIRSSRATSSSRLPGNCE